jgi:5'-3' exoribonuclease 1
MLKKEKKEKTAEGASSSSLASEMGIPRFYFDLIRTHSNVERRVTGRFDARQRVRLFVDFNAILHGCAARVVAAHPVDHSWDMIAEAVLDFVRACRAHFSPEVLVLATDGVAPLAKIAQQRKRRYLSAWTAQRVKRHRVREGLPLCTWDSNCITPGTEFMVFLDRYLTEALASMDEVVYSGHAEPEEGEQKILRYLREHPETGTTDVIYGMDADLIMLSLFHVHRYMTTTEDGEETGTTTTGTLYLYREDAGALASPAALPAQTSLLDIRLLGCSIRDTYKVDIPDYVFLCFLFGNDFLPNLPFLKIKHARDYGVQWLMRLYHAHCRGRRLVSPSGDIAWPTLATLFEALSKHEFGAMKSAVRAYQTCALTPDTGGPARSDPEAAFLEHLNRYPMRHKDLVLTGESFDVNGFDNWRLAYYHRLMGDHSANMIAAMCRSYVRGLEWMCDYYFKHVNSQQWYYPFANAVAPYASDVYDHVATGAKQVVQSVHAAAAPDIPFEVQLLLVTPPASKGVLSRRLQEPYTSVPVGVAHLFPVEYSVNTFMKYNLYECAPRIPIFDGDDVARLCRHFSSNER